MREQFEHAAQSQFSNFSFVNTVIIDSWLADRGWQMGWLAIAVFPFIPNTHPANGLASHEIIITLCPPARHRGWGDTKAIGEPSPCGCSVTKLSFTLLSLRPHSSHSRNRVLLAIAKHSDCAWMLVDAVVVAMSILE
jgi:hypothetical protein